MTLSIGEFWSFIDYIYSRKASFNSFFGQYIGTFQITYTLLSIKSRILNLQLIAQHNSFTNSGWRNLNTKDRSPMLNVIYNIKTFVTIYDAIKILHFGISVLQRYMIRFINLFLSFIFFTMYDNEIKIPPVYMLFALPSLIRFLGTVHLTWRGGGGEGYGFWGKNILSALMNNFFLYLTCMGRTKYSETLYAWQKISFYSEKKHIAPLLG